MRLLPVGQKEEREISAQRKKKESPHSPTFETPTGKQTSWYPRLVFKENEQWVINYLFLPISSYDSLSFVPWPELSAVRSTDSGDTRRGFACTSYSRLLCINHQARHNEALVGPSK